MRTIHTHVYEETKKQKILAITIGMMLFFSPCSLFINLLVEQIVGRAVSFDSAILYLILAIYLCRSIYIVMWRMKTLTLLIPLFFLLSYVVSYAVHPDTQRYMFTSWTDVVDNKAYWHLINSLPAFMLIRRIWDYDLLTKYLQRFSLVVVCMSFGTLAIYLGMGSQPSYMSFSYDLLIPCILLFYGFFTEKKLVYLVGALVASFMMFFCGARGPLLCLLVALLFYILFLTKNLRTKIIAVLISVAIVLCMVLFWGTIMNVLYDIANDMGINSRMVQKISEGTLTDDSGRSDVTELLLSNLSVFGSGLYGDRVITGGRYAHNLYVELLVQYGLVFGTILCIAISLVMLCGFFARPTQKKRLFLALLASSFVKLMLSSSYLSKEPAFYAMLGLCLSCICNDELKVAENMQQQKEEIRIRNISKYIKKGGGSI